MRFADMFPGTYLKASDFDGGPRTLTIRSCGIEDIGSGENKAVLHFYEMQQGLVLNKTNGSALAENPNFGGETDNWLGKQIIAQAERTSFQGKSVMGIRIYPSPNQPQQPQQPAYQPPAPGMPTAQPGLPGIPPVTPAAVPAPPGMPGQSGLAPVQPAQQPGTTSTTPAQPPGPPAWSQ